MAAAWTEVSLKGNYLIHGYLSMALWFKWTKNWPLANKNIFVKWTGNFLALKIKSDNLNVFS